MKFNDDVRHELINFIQDSSFPCFMAKSVAKIGLMHTHTIEAFGLNEIKKTQSKLYQFINEYRKRPDRLSSFALIIKNTQYNDFNLFEKYFWHFLEKLHHLDKRNYLPDQNVSSQVEEDNFSYSIKSEAFFILALHPQSPRWARRFKYPAIIFNPHAQFEALKVRGLFNKIRDAIRIKDKLLQGFFNPMLSNFGERTEVFQYLGKTYGENENVPLNI